MQNPFEIIAARLSNIEALLIDIKHQPSTPVNVPADALPILSAKQVKDMTGWPDGTFYQKVHQMPEGVVIRGKSKRLLFDRIKLISWLTASDEADALPFGPVKKKKGGEA